APTRHRPRKRTIQTGLSACAGNDGDWLASIPDHHQAIGPRLAAPGLAVAAEQLTHIGAAPIARECGEAFGDRIEALDRVAEPIGRPDPVLVVDIDRVSTGGVLRHRVDPPPLPRPVGAADSA